jgi:hypothetical protein
MGMGGIMSDIKLAIEYFEDAVRESDEIIDDCSDALKTELTKQKGHFSVALDALRAQQERENSKPCEYCAMCRKVAASDKPDGLLGMLNKIEFPFISVKVISEGIKVKGIEPEFCPMCGRPLEPKDITS